MALEKEVYDVGRISWMLEDRIIELGDKLEDFEEKEIRKIKDGLNEFTAYPYVVETFMDGIRKIGYHSKSTRWDGSTDSDYISYVRIPDVGIENLSKLTEMDIEIMQEVLTGNYCDAWLYDIQQGTPEEKALDIVIRNEYTLYPTVKAYETERDKTIDECVGYHEYETDDEKKEYREELLSETEKHAIYLKSGKVVYILLTISESLESV